MAGNALRINDYIWDCGGLRFHVFFTVGHGIGRGATCKVFGMVNDTWTEMFRFCDFDLEPHFHVPSSGPQIDFDRSLGEPMEWFSLQIRDHLGQFVTEAGYASILPNIDLTVTDEMAALFTKEMLACRPGPEQLAAAIETWQIRMDEKARKAHPV